MFPLYAPGVGWVFQPALPVSPGCVYAPVEQPKAFGFRLATLGGLALLALVWLSFTHPVEVIGAILAAVSLEAVLRLGHDVSRTLRHWRKAKKGGWS
ncbi:hypothetical protein ACFTUC_38850 [Streptomyces sp. NPDC056944]|uniref:hypothetical protein n=1 Tax=unclassified Streptomyces TaxID=2593676 RepID=UPI00363F6504